MTENTVFQPLTDAPPMPRVADPKGPFKPNSSREIDPLSYRIGVLDAIRVIAANPGLGVAYLVQELETRLLQGD